MSDVECQYGEESRSRPRPRPNRSSLCTSRWPEYFVDRSGVACGKGEVCYKRGKFLGRGSFARCFVTREVTTGRLFAAKVLEKAVLSHPLHSCFLLEELAIHRTLRHKNVVTFHQAFEDGDSICVILELCSNGTLMDLQMRRKSLTLVEAKYYLRQILSGVHYLHRMMIVHGDLKLSNIFISGRMVVKIGDFGLATALSGKRDQIQIHCGTPNYMAPEIVQRRGHSYAGDVWAIGCIMYGLIVGRLPFQGELKGEDYSATYDRIRNCEFSVYEPGLRKQASTFIRKILKKEPDERPSIAELKNDDFLQGFVPQSLPRYTLWDPPLPRDLMPPRTISKTMATTSKTMMAAKKNRRSRRLRIKMKASLSPGHRLLTAGVV